MISGLALAKASFARDRAYLLNHIVNNIGSLIFGYINVRIWLAVLGATPEGQSAVTYMMVNQAGLWLVMFIPHGCYIPNKVREGTIAFERLRPYGLLYGTFFELAGHLAYNFLFRSMPIFWFSVLFMGVSLPEPAQILPYFITLTNGALIAFFLNYFVGLWSIRFISINGVQMLYYFFTAVFSGAFIHMQYYPAVIRKISMSLPFAYSTYVPAAVYQGTYSLADALLHQGFWILTLSALAVVLTKQSLKHLVIQGG